MMAKWNLAKKGTFKHCLTQKIKKYGYWSEEVYIFNNETQMDLPYHVWKQWHDEVKAELKGVQ